jgi:hypothetical protein
MRVANAPAVRTTPGAESRFQTKARRLPAEGHRSRQHFFERVVSSLGSLVLSPRDTRGSGTAQVGTPSRGNTHHCRAIQPPNTPSTVNIVSIFTPVTPTRCSENAD